jgi:5-methylcytosine-specific restriction protein A
VKLVPGQVYRRREIHEAFGGQRQGGISTPAEHPVVLLFTGEQGAQYGYHDGFQTDETFWYTGEGQVGDMQMVRGNRAIRDHAAAGRAMHLFQYVEPGRVRYMGEATYLDHHMQTAPDREGNQRQAIVFELDVDGAGEEAEAPNVAAPLPKTESKLWGLPLDQLAAMALQKPAPAAPAAERKRVTYVRSQAVRVYVLRRAAGVCEGCNEPAPFTNRVGQPYLEPHHIRRVADGGPDHPRWVTALCPNCHRRVHYGTDGVEFNRVLGKRVGELEHGAIT